jgi:hypothetical protein
MESRRGQAPIAPSTLLAASVAAVVPRPKKLSSRLSIGGQTRV